MMQQLAIETDDVDVIDRHFADLTPEATSQLRARLASIPDGYSIRGALLSLVGPALAATRPQRVARWEAFEREFDRTTPFGFVSFRRMLLFMAQAAHLFEPGEDLDVAGNALAATSAEIIWDSHIMKPMLRASEGNLPALLDLYTRAVRLICNTGSMQLERRGRNAASIHIEDLPTTALSIVLPGFWQALAQRLSEYAHVELHHHGPMTSELALEWH